MRLDKPILVRGEWNWGELPIPVLVPLLLNLTSSLAAIKNHIIKYCEKVHERSGKNLFWSIKTRVRYWINLSLYVTVRPFCLLMVVTLYNTVPLNLIKENLLPFNWMNFPKRMISLLMLKPTMQTLRNSEQTLKLWDKKLNMMLGSSMTVLFISNLIGSV